MKASATALPPESEDDFATWVHDGLTVNHWRWLHVRPARTLHGWCVPGEGDIKGWPDLVACHPKHGGLAVELKSDKGHETPEQIAWLNAFGWTGWRAEVWRPRDRAHALAVLRGES